MKPRYRVGIVPLGVCVGVLLTAAMAWPQNYSHVRIVRLSFVEGTVTVERPDVPEWASAPVNTPIQEGFKLSTAENGFAEVEFENDSTARLGQLSRLEFTQLALSPTGGKINRITLQQGYATFSVIPEGDDIYEVKTRDATVTPYGKTIFRIDLDEGLMRVEVFKGSAEVSSPHGSETLARDMVFELRPGAEQAVQISQSITKDDWDQWVEQREGAETTARNSRAPGLYSPDFNSPQYGWNDLSNYGWWSYFSGYGYGWLPFVPLGWAPYSFGRWCWYPGFGYTWISAEPWGWLPYHFGEWVYVPGTGWCWLPSNFGAWFPAQVIWHQGPGWVAWAPRTGGSTKAGQDACLTSKGCTTAVSLQNFQNGKPVTPGSIMTIDPTKARLVATPDIPPTRLAMLPGAPLPQPATETRIVFDPVNRHFVNSNATEESSAVTRRSPASPAVGSEVTHPASPVNSAAAPVSGPSKGLEIGAETPTPFRASFHVAPKSPPVLVPNTAFPSWLRTDSVRSSHESTESAPFGGRSAPGSSSHASEGSVSHSAPASSSGSLGGSRSGGGLSGVGGGGGGTSGGGHSGGGSSSGSHR